MLLAHSTKSTKQNYDRRNTRAVRDREAAQLFRFYPSGGGGRALAGTPACLGDEGKQAKNLFWGRRCVHSLRHIPRFCAVLRPLLPLLQ